MSWNWTPARVDPGPLHLPMARQIWIEGRISDPSGAPIEGAWAYVTNDGPWGEPREWSEVLRALGTPGDAAPPLQRRDGEPARAMGQAVTAWRFSRASTPTR